MAGPIKPGLGKESMIITACMIVKDEEKNIRRCLDSILDLVDNIVVVDTGSKDKTPDICKDYGAKVYDHPWQNDFSLHRNQSIDYAPDNTDWIFIIDADEEIIGDALAFRDILERVPDKIEGVAIEMLDMAGDKAHCRFNTPRFFRKGTVEYFGLVHNYAHTETLPLAAPGIQLKHYGYDLSPEEKKKKRERTVPLLMKRLDTNPYDYQVFFYLAQIYGEDGQLEKAIYYGSRYAEVREQMSNFNPTIYYLLIVASMHLGDWQTGEKWIAEGIRHCPDDLDLAKAMLDYGITRQNAWLVAEGSRKFILAYDEYTRNLGSRGGRFVFNYDEKVLCHALYNLSMISMKDGKSLLERLTETLETINDDIFKQRIIKRVDAELEGMNVRWTNKGDMIDAI